MGDQSTVSVELANGLDAMSAVPSRRGTVEAVLELLVSLARTSLDRVDGASVSVRRPGSLETATATSEEVLSSISANTTRVPARACKPSVTACATT